MAIRDLLHGVTAHDPEGVECRIGAWWARLFLKRGWALAAARKVWFKNKATFDRYLSNPHWRAHEHHHLKQEREIFRGSTFRYLASMVWQYIRYMSHDRAPFEIEAEAAADQAYPKPDGHSS